MGFFSLNRDNNGAPLLEGQLRNQKEVEQEILYMELAYGLTDEEKRAFVKSDYCKELQEAGLIAKHSLVRLSKSDDLNRREKLVAFQLAKERKDPLWDQLVKNRIKERQLIKSIMTKYKSGAVSGAKKSQKSYLKSIKGKLASMPSI